MVSQTQIQIKQEVKLTEQDRDKKTGTPDKTQEHQHLTKPRA